MKSGERCATEALFAASKLIKEQRTKAMFAFEVLSDVMAIAIGAM
jgi:hypothetical protein